MKRLLSVLSSMSLFALGGCASVNSSQTSAYEIDKAQVAAVEAAARQLGVQVYWLNYPQKKAEK